MDALEPFPSERNRQFTGDEVFFSDHLCRASLPRERRGLVGACQVDLGPGGCRDSVSRRDEKQAFPDGEVQAAVVHGDCYVPEVPVVLEQCTTLGRRWRASRGTCGNEALHAELGRVFRQVPVVLKQWMTPLDGGVPAGGVPAGGLLGTWACCCEALHAEPRGVSRQAFHVSVPTFRLKLDLLKLSKQVSFDGD